MTNVDITYNPFFIETEIKINGKPSEGAWRDRAKGGVRLQVWLSELFSDLIDECNDDLTVTFHGTSLDYDDVRAAAEEYCKHHPETKIDFNKPTLAANAEERVEKLKDLFRKLHQECPFDSLRSDELKQAFDEAMGTTFKVSVIATMSSGKSTLINAMLSQELMPAKNEACTATIARIQDDDAQGDFSGVCFDARGQVIDEARPLTSDKMKTWNEDEKVADIDIRGDIPFVTSKNTQLVLEDTPGPNNSRTEAHKIHTYKVIQSEAKPMVLYILNVTQIGTNDDSYLLKDVAEAMKVGGKQSRDRFIFVANKADVVDTEKESLPEMLDHVKKYLEDKGILNPAVYPVSAEYAKIIRMKQSGRKLSKRQLMDCKSAPDLFNENLPMHLEAYAPFSPAIRHKLQYALEVQKASETEDADYNEALIHTGVPGVEMAIREYVDRYALTNKITTGVATFQQKIAEKHLEADLLEHLQGNEKERQRLQDQIELVEKQIQSGDTGPFKKRMDEAIKIVNEQIMNRRKDIFNRFNGRVVEVDNDKELTMEEAERLVSDLLRRTKSVEANLKAQLEAMVDETVGRTAKLLVEEYNKQYRLLLEGKELDADVSTTVAIMTADMPQADYFVKEYRKERRWQEKVGEDWAGNKNKAWYKPWTWFDDEYHKVRDIYEDRYEEYVLGSSINDNYVRLFSQTIDDNITDASSHARQEAESFKQWFQEQLADIDKAVQKKTGELKTATSSEASIKSKIEEDKQKLEWLNRFQKDLEDILRV